MRKIFLGLTLILLSPIGPQLRAASMEHNIAAALAGKGSHSDEHTGIYAYWQSKASDSARLSLSKREIIKKFSEEKLHQAWDQTESALYAFGGPDVIYPLLFFPKLKNLILVALEDPGTLPSLEKAQALQNDIKELVRQIVDLSFYRTVDMDTKLKVKPELAALTKILVGLILMDQEILSVERVAFSADGEIEVVDPLANMKTRSLRITFMDPENPQTQRHIYYFQQNLGDFPYKGFPSLKESPAFQNFILSQKPFTAFFKAASYFPKESYFSTINELALQADFLLQTDTGIPLKLLKTRRDWELTLFGDYSRAIARSASLSSKNFMPDLAEAYELAKKGESHSYGGELPFPYDYTYRNFQYGVRGIEAPR